MAENLFKSGEVDGATAVAHEFDTTVNLINATGKLISIRNSGIEKMYLDPQGNLDIEGNLTLSDTIAFEASAFILSPSGMTFKIDTDNDESATFSWKNGSDSEILSLDEEGTVNNAGGYIHKRTATATNYNISSDDYYIGVTDTTVSRTIQLMSALVSAGRIFIVKDESGAAGTNNISITTEGAETIDGQSNYTISVNYGAAIFICDGTNWFVL